MVSGGVIGSDGVNGPPSLCVCGFDEYTHCGEGFALGRIQIIKTDYRAQWRRTTTGGDEAAEIHQSGISLWMVVREWSWGSIQVDVRNYCRLICLILVQRNVRDLGWGRGRREDGLCKDGLDGIFEVKNIGCIQPI